jgi:hypothetical protein
MTTGETLDRGQCVWSMRDDSAGRAFSGCEVASAEASVL